MPEPRPSVHEYWRRNQRLIVILLAIWFAVSYLFAIFLAEPLYTIKMGSLPMSFWWAQQGSMFIFVILVFVYAWRMDRLDREYGVDELEAPDPVDSGSDSKGVEGDS